MKSLEEVVALFDEEFSSIHERFKVHAMDLKDALISTDPALMLPGVYVYWRKDVGVIKVGKHQVNVRKRALEHLRDNTRNERMEMRPLMADPDCKLILFTLPRKEDLHWVASLESFLERRTEPVIPSARNG